MDKCNDEITIFRKKTRTRADLTREENSRKKMKKTTPYNSPLRRSNFDSTAVVVVAVQVDDENANCSSSEVITGSSSSDFPTSCCSSNENCDHLLENDVVKDNCITDPEVENGEASSRYNDSHTTIKEKEEREEAIKSNGEDHSTAKSTVRIKTMPSDSEIEEFFAAVERDIQKRFIDKYNFDIVKDVPLEGRYEWVQIKL